MRNVKFNKNETCKGNLRLFKKDLAKITEKNYLNHLNNITFTNAKKADLFILD